MEEKILQPQAPAGETTAEAKPVAAEPAPAGTGNEAVEESSGSLEEGVKEEIDLNSLQEELAAREAALAELQQRYLRLQADFENYRKRTRREQEELSRMASARLVKDLLPVLDNLELALAAAAGAEKEDLATGVEMTLRHFREILSREGLTQVVALGQPFDPELHEAVAREETTEPEKINQVVEEFRRGYTLHGKLLRPAMVKVAVAAAVDAQQDLPETGEQGVE